VKIKLPESVRKLNTKKNKRRIILADYVLLALVIVILITARTPGEIDAVEVTSTSYNSVALKWDPVSNADGYHVYRSEDGKEYKYLTTAQTSAYEDKDLHTGTKYTYAIAPYNGIRRNGITDAPVAEATPELATARYYTSSRLMSVMALRGSAGLRSETRRCISRSVPTN